MRIIEILVGLSAIGSIATFLGFRALFRKTVRSLGRRPGSKEPEAIDGPVFGATQEEQRMLRLRDPRQGLVRHPDDERRAE